MSLALQKPMLYDDYDSMLPNSAACTKIEEMIYLRKVLGSRRFVATMLYRGSKDGFYAINFHSLCDGRNQTISLFKLAHNGDCIGGYTAAQWSSPDEGVWVSDPSAVVFSLSRQQSFNVKNADHAIYCDKTCGPYFGNSLKAFYQPFNGFDRCLSRQDTNYEDIYSENKSLNLLTNKKRPKLYDDDDQQDDENDDEFSISEIEVWQVQFE